MRQKKLAKEMSFAADDTFQGAVGNKTFTPEYLEGVKDNLSYYKRIQELINANKWAEALEEMDKLAKQLDMIDNPVDLAGVVSRWNGTWETGMRFGLTVC